MKFRGKTVARVNEQYILFPHARRVHVLSLFDSLYYEDLPTKELLVDTCVFSATPAKMLKSLDDVLRRGGSDSSEVVGAKSVNGTGPLVFTRSDEGIAVLAPCGDERFVPLIDARRIRAALRRGVFG